MSSLNDSAGAGSHNASIPLDVEDSSVTIYSDEELASDFDGSSQVSEEAASSLDYSSVSRTYLSHSRASRVRAPSEDFTGTGSYYSNGGGGGGSHSVGEEEDYSSTYGSLSYGDSALRSPQSELSSTFASFYYDNAYAVNTRATLHFLRRPLYYFAFAIAGSGTLSSACRLATTFAQRFVDGRTNVAESYLDLYGREVAGLGCQPGVPPGYPTVPEWLQGVRASLPKFLEVPAAWMLRLHGIPVLSEVMKPQRCPSTATAASNAATHISSGVQEAWQAWQKTGPAIPVALFLPVFSLVVLKVAKHVRPHPMNFTEELQQMAEVDGVGATLASGRSPSGLRPSPSVDASPIPPPSSSPGNISAQSTSMDVPPTSRGNVVASVNQRSATGESRDGALPSPSSQLPVVPPVNIGRATGISSTAPPLRAVSDGVSPRSPEDDPAELRSRSRSTTLVPQTHRHVADVDVVTDGEGRIGEMVGVEEAHRSPPMPTAAEDYDPALKAAAPLSSSSAVSPPPRPPDQAWLSGGAAARRTAVTNFPLSGDVVAAVAGPVDAPDANYVIMAAVRYGCSVVLLPASLRGVDGLLGVPPSLTMEFADDVVIAATLLSRRRGLTVVGVTMEQWEEAAEPLNSFVHPDNAIYIFVAGEVLNMSVVAQVRAAAQRSIFVGMSQPELPASPVFYDRYQKEKIKLSPPS